MQCSEATPQKHMRPTVEGESVGKGSFPFQASKGL